MIRIEVAGKPQGKGRARSFRRGNFIGHYTPENTRTYEGLIRSAAIEAMNGHGRIEGPVELRLTAIFDVPESYSRTKRSEALAGVLKPTKKPDLDNIIKAFCDGLNGVVFKDDVQIVRGEYAKKYGPEAKVVALVVPL